MWKISVCANPCIVFSDLLHSLFIKFVFNIFNHCMTVQKHKEVKEKQLNRQTSEPTRDIRTDNFKINLPQVANVKKAGRKQKNGKIIKKNKIWMWEQPITNLNLKSERGVRVGNASVQQCFFAFVLLVISFCTLSVLYALVHSGPGGNVWRQEEGGPVKEVF